MLDGEIGTISPPLQAEPPLLTRIFLEITRRTRTVLGWTLRAVILTLGVALFVIALLGALVHIWLLPVVLAVRAFRERRAKSQSGQAPYGNGEGPGVLQDGHFILPQPVESRGRPFLSRHRRRLAFFFLIVGIVAVPWSHYVNHDPWSEAPLWVLAIWAFLAACLVLFVEFDKATEPSRSSDPTSSGTGCGSRKLKDYLE